MQLNRIEEGKKTHNYYCADYDLSVCSIYIIRDEVTSFGFVPQVSISGQVGQLHHAHCLVIQFNNQANRR